MHDKEQKIIDDMVNGADEYKMKLYKKSWQRTCQSRRSPSLRYHLD